MLTHQALAGALASFGSEHDPTVIVHGAERAGLAAARLQKPLAGATASVGSGQNCVDASGFVASDGYRVSMRALRGAPENPS
jgi:hypothetical protein